MATPTSVEDAVHHERIAHRDVIPPVLLLALTVGVLVLAVLAWQYGIVFSSALIWGLALYVAGVLGGFLFGIPKVPDRAAPEPKKKEAPAGGGNAQEGIQTSAAEASRRGSGINSNLVEVSDWLTKIIIGVGLVELKKLPDHFAVMANYMAASLVLPPPAGKALVQPASLAAAIALYFLVLGFITGYLMTKVFLAVIMNVADSQAEEASTWRLPAGEVIGTSTMLNNLRRTLDDLQAKVAAFFDRTPAARQGVPADPQAVLPAGAVPLGPDAAVPLSATLSFGGGVSLPTIQPATLQSILWVDDHPERHALIVDKLKTAGVNVQQLASTELAMDALKRTDFGIVITDMHRGERSSDGMPSGLRLIRGVVDLFGGPQNRRSKPFLILYCGSSSWRKYHHEAAGAGAQASTSSEVELLAILSRLLPAIRL